jgi:hypothetical protein
MRRLKLRIPHAELRQTRFACWKYTPARCRVLPARDLASKLRTQRAFPGDSTDTAARIAGRENGCSEVIGTHASAFYGVARSFSAIWQSASRLIGGSDLSYVHKSPRSQLQWYSKQRVKEKVFEGRLPSPCKIQGTIRQRAARYNLRTHDSILFESAREAIYLSLSRGPILALKTFTMEVPMPFDIQLPADDLADIDRTNLSPSKA